MATISYQNAIKYSVIGIIQLYRLLISPVLGQHCRFYPSCSAYASEAINRHGIVRGLWLTLKRLSRCHPWGGCGIDPVPTHPLSLTTTIEK